MRILLLFLFLNVLTISLPARALLSCDTPSEVIVTLQPPRLGVPTVWDATYGQSGKMVQLQSGLPLEGGTVMALGRVLAKEDFKPESIVLAELNRRGRVLSENLFPAKPAEVPVKMIAVKGGYLAVSNIRGGAKLERRQIRLAWYTGKGAFRREKIIQDEAYDYDAHGMLHAAESEGILLVAQATARKDESDQHGLILRLNSDGQQVWRRAYRPGIPNQIQGVQQVDGNGYIATGRIRLDDGRMAGWVLRLGYDGTVLWQRTYPRGLYAALRQGVPQGGMNGGFYLAGEITPSDGGPNASWLLALDAHGEPRWQRYFRRMDTAFAPVGIMRAEGGRLIMALNARAMEGSGQRNHVRMLILTSRGALIDDESYIEGIEARAGDFITGWNGERIITATIESDAQPLNIEMVGDTIVVPETPDDDEAGPPPKEKPVLKGWVFVATALDPYEDPCDKQPQ